MQEFVKRFFVSCAKNQNDDCAVRRILLLLCNMVATMLQVALSLSLRVLPSLLRDHIRVDWRDFAEIFG